MSGSSPERAPLTSRIVEAFLEGNLSVLLLILSLLAGGVALLVTPREEDPQIVVPLVDVLVEAPGCSAEEVERQVATRLETMLYEIDGVEYVYSVSEADAAVVTARFYVGEDREDSLLKVYNKISMNADRVPPQVTGWVVRPVEIDDVPILSVTLYGDEAQGDYPLRRVAEEIASKLKEVPNTGRTQVVGGRPRALWVHLDPYAAAAHGLSWQQLARALRAADVRAPAGTLERDGESVRIDACARLGSPREVEELVVGVHEGAPVFLGDVAEVELGPGEPSSYTRLGFGPAAPADRVPPEFRGTDRDYPAVTVAVAKRKGSNAVWVAEDLLERLGQIEDEILPDGVHWYVTRNYGETANDKVNELIEGLGVAIVIVIVLIAMALGWREGFIVATAVPITFALTLLVNYLAGYTINRVTLFALILALGLVVDDPIVDVENIYRHLRMGSKSPRRAVLDAVNEVRPPIILATLAIIVSFVPLFFITGMMGPYMAPMALNVPLAMLMSLVVAFTITPWLSYHVLSGHAGVGDGHGGSGREGSPVEPGLLAVYRRVLGPFLARRGARWALLGVTSALFVASCWLAVDRRVPLKMLPYDNKNELQLVIDMPEGTTLERTEAVAAEFAAVLRQVPEVTDVSTYVGLSSPMDFNGLVRHYYLRRGDHVADVRVNLVHKKQRVQQSHEIALRLRRELEGIAERNGAALKIVELPPGPPVLATLVAEVYGRPYTPYARQLEAAEALAARLRREPGVVDVDTTVEAPQPRVHYVPDREKLRLSGISEEEVAWTLAAAVRGAPVAVLHDAADVDPTPVLLRLRPESRASAADLDSLAVGGRVRLSEVGRWVAGRRDQSIYRKNLRRVVYVSAELAGRPPAEVVLDVTADEGQAVDPAASPRPLAERSFLDNGGGLGWSPPKDVQVVWSGEGEWKITLDVFRDLGLAFAAACLGIYVLLVYETGSYLLPVVLMISIPLTVIGILPGFWLLSAVGGAPVDGWANPTFFTATGMIGMIALSGLAVRNAILLIEFVRSGQAEGISVREALIRGGAVRIRPILLTAGTAMLAAWPITLDPIFSGLAWALIFGLLVSTAFTLLIIPVVYFMVYGPREASPEAGRSDGSG
ncbi:MAG: efflux RND transporter permease subunit [Planctomycetota bacterium]|nr:MAG: efflux RND transporter permease subunit [Planctomycetota bacterium]